MNKTILFLTDNSVSDEIFQVVKKHLLDKAGDLPIVSVSQKPIDLGKNICVGEIGRSWMSLYTQILAGLEEIKTEYIGIAEHDCLYSSEHLNWLPPKNDTFYYNYNHWLLQWGGNHPELNGMFSYWPKRHALSQMVCAKDLFKQIDIRGS